MKPNVKSTLFVKTSETQLSHTMFPDVVKKSLDDH